MSHVCDGVLHHGRWAVSVAATGRHPECVHVRELPAPCTRQPTAPRALPGLSFAWTRQLDDETASYVRADGWKRVDHRGVVRVAFPREPKAVLHGVALYDVADGRVESSVVDRPSEGTEGLLKLGSVTYVPEQASVPRELLDPDGLAHASTWTGPRILPAVPSAWARDVCTPEPRLALEVKESTEPIALWVVAFAFVARGRAGQTLRLDATWQTLRTVMQRLCGGARPSTADPRLGWLIFLLKQERPAPVALKLANALLLSRDPDPAQNTLRYSLDPGHARRFLELVNRLQRSYPFPMGAGPMLRFALATNVDREGHFLYLPIYGADAAIVSRDEAAPYEGPRDIHVAWRDPPTRKALLSVVAVVAVLHLYSNKAWLRALECAQLRAGVKPNELRGWGSILKRLKMPSPELLPRCRTELHAAQNAAFNILHTSTEKGNPTVFALAMDLVQALRRKEWSEAFVKANTMPAPDVPPELVPRGRAWHRCYLQNVLWALHEDWGDDRCAQCDRDAANAPYEAAAGVVPPNDTHTYLVLPEYALWCALGRDDASLALAGVNSRAAAEEAVLRAGLGAKLGRRVRLFNRALERHPSFL